jgi:hypothetical protein
MVIAVRFAKYQLFDVVPNLRGGEVLAQARTEKSALLALRFQNQVFVVGAE